MQNEYVIRNKIYLIVFKIHRNDSIGKKTEVIYDNEVR